MKIVKPEELHKTNNKRVLISDCEGPITKNDNAFEISRHFIPDGDKLFALLSKYDDVLADIVKKSRYKAGDTLRLILPFLKAYRVTNEKIRQYSSKNILLVPGAIKTLHFIKEMMPIYIVSTSYEQYISSFCNLTQFPYENVYCTRLNMDKYGVDEKETCRLMEISREISVMPMIEIQENTKSVIDFSLRDQQTIRRLDEIFWGEIPKMRVEKMINEINPLGGYQKTNAVQDIVRKTNSKLNDVMYIGDSITDVSPLQFVRGNGGLTISFNGNEYAIREAEIAVLSQNTIVISILADIFNQFGKERIYKMVNDWDYPTLEKYVNPKLRQRIIELYPKKLPVIEIITNENRERLTKESETFRKTVRGEAVGKLG